MNAELERLLYHANLKNDLDYRSPIYEEGINAEELHKRIHENDSYLRERIPKHIIRGVIYGTIAIFAGMSLATLMGADTTQVRPEFLILGMSMIDLGQYGLRHFSQNLEEVNRYYQEKDE